MKKLMLKVTSVLMLAFFIMSITPAKITAQGTVTKKAVNAGKTSKTSKVKELTDKRAENQEIFLNSDGTYSAIIYEEPKYFRQGDQYKKIDNSLIQVTDKSQKEKLTSNSSDLIYTTKANPIKAYLNNNISAADPCILNKDNSEIDIQPTGIANIKGKIITTSDNSRKVYGMNYINALGKGINILYIPTNTGIRQKIVISKSANINDFKFNLSLNDMDLININNGLYIKDTKNGQLKGIISQPYIYDSAKKADISEKIGVNYNPVNTNDNAKKTYSFDYSIDKTFAADKNTVYPVTIENDINYFTNQGLETGEVSKIAPDTNRYEQTLSHAGCLADNDKANLLEKYVKFSIPEDLKTAKIINTVYSTEEYRSDGSNILDIHRILKDWDAVNICWNNKPDYNGLPEDHEAAVISKNTCTYDITSIFNEDSSAQNYGFALTSSNDYIQKYKEPCIYKNSGSNYVEITYSLSPSAPQNFKVKAFSSGVNKGTGYINLSWKSVPHAAGYKVGIYNGKEFQYFDAGNSTSWTTKGKGLYPTCDELKKGSFTFHTDKKGSELSDDPKSMYMNAKGDYINSSNYLFTVVAYNKFGQESLENENRTKINMPDASAPEALSDILLSKNNEPSLKSKNSWQLKLAWNAAVDSPAGNSSGILNYQLSLYTVKNGKLSKMKSLNLSNGTSYVFDKLASDTEYRASVKAYDKNKNYTKEFFSNDVNTVIDPAETPKNIISSAAITSISISWDKAGNADGYEVEADGKIIDNSTNLNFVHSGLTPDTQHKYRIRSKNAAGPSEWSSFFIISTLKDIPSVPQNVTTIPQVSSITLQWDKVSNAESYIVEADGIDYSNIAGTSYILNNIMPGTSHTFMVKALNTYGESSWSIPVTVLTLPQIPGVPDNVIMSSTTTAINLMWSTVTYSAGYDIEFDGTIMDNGTDNTHKFSGLTPNTKHTIRLRSKNACGTSDWSAPYEENTLAYTAVSGTINQNIIWTKENSPYLITDDLIIPENTELDIQPGVVVKANDGKGILVKGKLDASGNQKEKVIFTSVNDITSDGLGQLSGASGWKGIWVYPDGEAVCDYSQIYLAGNIPDNMNFLNKSTIIVYGSLSLSNSTVNNSFGNGVYIDSDNNISINNCSLNNNKDNGISAVKWGTGLKVLNNQFNNNNMYPVYLNISQMNDTLNDILIKINNNTFSGNKQNFIALEGSLNHDITFNSDYNDKFVLLDISVPLGKTMTVQPETQLNFDSGKLLTVDGTVNAAGDPFDQNTTYGNTIFKAVTNNNAFPEKTSDYWKGILINKTGKFNGEFISIFYAGNWGIDETDPQDLTKIESQYEEKSIDNAVTVNGGICLKNSNIISSYGNGIYIDTSGPVEISHNFFSSSFKCYIKLYSYTGPKSFLSIDNNKATTDTTEQFKILFGIFINLNGISESVFDRINANNMGICLHGELKYNTQLLSNNPIKNSASLYTFLGVSISDNVILDIHDNLGIVLLDNLEVNGEINCVSNREDGNIKTEIYPFFSTCGGYAKDNFAINIRKTGKLLANNIGAFVINNEGKLFINNSNISDINDYGELFALNSNFENLTFYKDINPTVLFCSINCLAENKEDSLNKINLPYNYWNSELGPKSEEVVEDPNYTDRSGCCTKGISYTPYLTEPYNYNFDFNIKTPIHFGESGVNGVSGNFSRSYNDMTTSLGGADFELGRTYNSLKDNKNGIFGRGWSASFQGKISDFHSDADYKQVELPDGSVQNFKINSDGTFTADNSRNKLAKGSDGAFILTTKDQHQYGFSTSGYLAWEKDKNGNLINFDVDNSNGKVNKIYDSTGRTININYNSQGFVDTIEDPVHRTVKYEYQNGQLIKVTDPSENIMNYHYDSQGFLDDVKDTGGSLIEGIVYNHNDGTDKDKVYKITDANGNTNTYSYDGICSTVTDSSGRKNITWYDEDLYPIATLDPENRTKLTEYYTDDKGQNKLGEMKSVTDENGNVTTYERDDRGNVTKITNPDKSVKEYKYDDKNNITYEKNEAGKVTYYNYDSDGKNILQKVQPLNGTDIYDPASSDKSKFAITSYAYCNDSDYKIKGLLKSVTGPENNITTYTYDSKGYINSEQNAENKTTSISNNDIGWKTKTISPSGYITQYFYDNNGNIIKTVLNRGETSRVVYDTEGRKIKEVSARFYKADEDDIANNNYKGDAGTRYTYYPSGKIKTVTDAENNITAYTYDIYGNIKTVKKPDNAVYTYDYDGVNRLVKLYYSENDKASPALLSEYSYITLNDHNNQKTEKRYINGSETESTVYTYDYANRLIEQQNPDGTAEKTAYTPDGLEDNITDKNGNVTYYKYDGLNRLAETYTPFENDNGTVYYSYSYISYDKTGNKTCEKTGKSLVKKDEIPESFIQKNYEYYKDGNLKDESDSSGRRTDYFYDDDGILSRAEIKVNDSLKNITEYQNNYFGKPDVQIQHVLAKDIAGNSPDDSSDVKLITSYTYDKDGNIETVTTPDNNVATYDYDNLDRQKSISKNGQDEYGNSIVIKTSKTYNFGGKVLTETDADNNTTQYIYDGKDELIQKIDPEGGVYAYYYDNAGRKTAEVSPADYVDGASLDQMNRTEYDYDSMDRLKTSTEVYKNNNQWISVVSKALKYDNNGNIIKQLDAIGYEAGTGNSVDDKINSGYGTEYTYNLANKQITSLTADTKDRNLPFTTKTSYDGAGRKISDTNAKGAVTTYYYDDAGNVLKTTIKKSSNDPEQVLQSAAYDLTGNVITKTDGNGNVTSYEYNALNKVRKVNYPRDSSIQSYSVSYQYDVVGNLTKQLDSMGKFDLYSYDTLGRQLNHIEEASDGTCAVTTSVKYDKNGNKRFVTDGNGSTTENIYDSLNRLKETSVDVTEANGLKLNHTTGYTYDKNGNKLTETDFRGNTTIYNYDPINRLVSKIDAYGKIIEKLEYYDNDVQSKSYDALNNETQYFYDKDKRLIKTIDPENHSVQQTYDETGNKSVKTDGKGNITTCSYDELNRLKTVVNAKNETTSYTYDLNGNMLTQTDGKGNVTTFEYNAANKLMRKIDNGGRTGNTGSFVYNSVKTETYNYYPNGTIASKVDRNGKTSSYIYDIHGRKISETAGSMAISYTYDSRGNQLTMTDSTGTTTRTYDELGRTTSKTVPVIGKTVYQYDIIDSINGITIDEGCYGESTQDPKGNLTTKVYDKTGRLYQVSADNKTTTNSYYDDGSLKSVVYPDGSRQDYTYYRDKLLNTLVNKKSDGTIINSCSYTYDAAHNMLSKTEIKGTTSYDYDELNRLKTVKDPSGKITDYTFDASGNRQTETVTSNSGARVTTYSYNDQNRLTGAVISENGTITENDTFTYDNNGNQLTEVKIASINGVPGTAKKTQNIYDDLNQLVETINSDNIETDNTYNGEGTRVSKKVGDNTTNYLYEADKVILETDVKGNETARNVYGINLLTRTSSGQTAYYFYNGHADVISLSDSVSGNQLASYDYDEFGNMTKEEGTFDNPYRYAGYQYDSTTKDYYLISRMYDPETGRFLQEDTYRGDPSDALSLNLYTYCHNEPMMYDDPTGHFLNIVIGAIIGEVINVGITAISDYREHGKLTGGWKKYLGAAAEGAVMGAVGAATGGASLWVAAALDGGAAFAGNVLNQAISKDGKIDWEEAGYAGAAGTLSTIGGHYAGKALGKLGNAFNETKVGKLLSKKIANAKNLLSENIKSGISSFKEQIESGKTSGNVRLDVLVPDFSKNVSDDSSLSYKMVGNAEIEKAKLTPAERAAQKGFHGIGTTPKGGPDFAGTDYLYPVKEGQLNSIEIEMTGKRPNDFKLANEKAGFPDAGYGAPEGYTWHHLDDYNPETNKTTMQLVDSNAHDATKPHKGSAGQYDDINGPSYNPPKKKLTK